MGNSLRDLQLAETKMLKDITEFCDANDIVYFLYGGSLIGALRHKGFIPWDDDIDICMDIKNYRKFLKLASTGLADKYFLQNYETDPKAFYPWTQVRMKGTTSMPRDMIGYDIHYGICMDVFPFTQYARTILGRKLQALAIPIMLTLIEKHYCEFKKIPMTRKRHIITSLVPEFFRIPVMRLCEKLMFVELHDDGECFILDRMNLDAQPKFPRSILDPDKRVKVTYENIEVWTFGECEMVLEKIYGDWRTLPPEEQRHGHGDIIIDTEKNFTEYQHK